METKHTTGPWVIDWNVSRLDIFGSDETTLVASLRRSPLYQSIDEAARSNARLIAAAPELLEALRPFSALLEIFEQKSANRPKSGPIYATADHRVGGRELTVEHLKAARAAIAKAEGK